MLGTYPKTTESGSYEAELHLFVHDKFKKCVCVCVFVLDPLLFPYIGGRTQVLKAYLLV